MSETDGRAYRGAWTRDQLERLRADRHHDANRLAPQFAPVGAPDPREAAARHIRMRERIIQHIERRQQNLDGSLRKNFSQRSE